MKYPTARLSGTWLLLLPGVIAIQPTFGGWAGFVPGLVGITAGVLLGWAATRWHLTLFTTTLAVLVTYLLCGGVVVLPRTTVAGIFPTTETLHRLLLLLWQCWADLLTVATPAGDFSGPAAAPLLAGLVIATAAASLAARTKAVLLPLLFPVLWLIFGIAFGIRLAPTAAWLGVVLAVGMLIWLWCHELAAQRSANVDILINHASEKSQLLRQGVAAFTILTVTGSAAVGITALTGYDVNRYVLRDDITPPLQLRNYPSPLMGYRALKLDYKDVTIFTVAGMPEGARLRLAVLDTYDGNVFSVSQEANQYLRAGRNLTQDISANASLNLSVGQYNNVWVPLVGEPRWVEFSGPRSAQLADGTYYNRSAGQALTISKLRQGDAYRLEARVAPERTAEQRDALGASKAGTAGLAKMTMVPDILTTLAAEYTEGADSAYAQLVAIEKKLRQEGYYSDGSDGKSRSGHSTERLSSMFQANALIGDDEQYATAMAIMANQLGVPARVVMGFYPETSPGGSWQVKGGQAHVWVEANFADVGWVTFDPTPEREPQTEVPKPKPKPKPQVDPPPNPPERLPEEPVLADQQAADQEGEDEKVRDLRLLYWAVGGLGVGTVISGPFLVILALKARRLAKRKRTGLPAQRVASGWDEVVDRARDLGYVAATSQTRRQTAQSLERSYPGVAFWDTATDIDALLFGPEPIGDSEAEATWQQVQRLRGDLGRQVPWHRRVRAAFSLRSLRKASVTPTEQPEKPIATPDTETEKGEG